MAPVEPSALCMPAHLGSAQFSLIALLQGTADGPRGTLLLGRGDKVVGVQHLLLLPLGVVQGTNVVMDQGARGTLQWYAAALVQAPDDGGEDEGQKHIRPEGRQHQEEERRQDGAQRHQAQRQAPGKGGAPQRDGFASRHEGGAEDHSVLHRLSEHRGAQGCGKKHLVRGGVASAAITHWAGVVLVLLAVAWSHASVACAVGLAVAAALDLCGNLHVPWPISGEEVDQLLHDVRPGNL
mmetsp:Transcript_93956/g.223584  ORF Transcript_93956/g.223584 Transcript_93956/m.223584 type:complete len:238 (-) Transcript_93956:2082-2795(-)